MARVASDRTHMPGKTVVILQSNYIPWKGYFDLIATADEFILYDDMQYTRRDWRNRNKIKSPSGPLWLTIPVEVKGKYSQTIKETRIADPGWPRAHWKTIQHNYARAPYFRQYHDVFEELFLGCEEEHLSRVNFRFLTGICRVLDIHTRITWSMDYEMIDGKTKRLVDLCRQAGATDYVSGPSARGYLDEALFQSAGIGVRWMNYSNYPEYPQIHPPFDHAVSVVDLILNTGAAARTYMKAT
ncbi:MAG TPA: WbqC family protein [Thermoanaerobaculia bacterium]|jgi:hypothetical protein|nr:WbqC family protein [Thermoanaerobaculia bacterium]